MPATAMERRLTPLDTLAESRGRLGGSNGLGRAWPCFLPLLAGLALVALSAGSGAAGACSGTGITLADLPEASAALRGVAG